MTRVLGPYLRKRVAVSIIGLLAALTGLMQLLELLDVTTDVLNRNLGVTGIVHYAGEKSSSSSFDVHLFGAALTVGIALITQMGEQADYLRALESGTKLYARKCPDGEGKYYMVGKRPKIKPEKVGCVDVHFEARCPGSARGSTGVSKNFLGIATDCFMGDTTTIEPKPACPVDQVSVLVRSIRPCQ